MSFRSEVRAEAEGGFSLIEVILVLLIMGILTSIAAQKWSNALEQSRFDATRTEMERLALAIAGNPDLTANGLRSDFGYVGDVGALPVNLDALVTNPGLGTWNGPYVQNDFNQDPSDYKADAWGSPYAYAGGTIITSNGSGRAITKQFAGAPADLLSNSVVGTVTDGLDTPPGDSALSVFVSVTYPNGTGTLTTASMSPGSGGDYTFAGRIPIGNHMLRAIYHADTLVRYVSVLPKSTAYVNFRFPGDLWSAAGGGGGGGSGLAYVAGSAISYNSGKDFSFDVTNNSGAPIQISSIGARYAAAIYYEQVLWDASILFNSAMPRGASGERKAFPPVDIGVGETVTIRYNSFKLCVTGGCSAGDTRGDTFTVGFSDGSAVSFAVL